MQHGGQVTSSCPEHLENCRKGDKDDSRGQEEAVENIALVEAEDVFCFTEVRTVLAMNKRQAG